MGINRKLAVAGLALVAIFLLFAIWMQGGPSVWGSFKDPATEKLLKDFIALKTAQAEACTNGAPPEIRHLLKEAAKGDWLTFSNSFWELGERNRNFASGTGPAYWKTWPTIGHFVAVLEEKTGWNKHIEAEERRLRGTPWEAAKEVWGAFDGFVVGDEKYSTMFGREIIDSIPAGSLYFGGTDPGRFLVTAMCRSQPDGDPFFVLTQNALADSTYLGYLQTMYGKKLYVLTAADAQVCFQSYAAEKITASPGKSVVISGQPDVMEINGLLAKVMIDKNPGRECFIYESFPLDWMYPYLEPHGLIFKINRQPLDRLSDEILQRDHDFWTNQVRPMIGGWLTDETSVKDIAAFVARTFGRKDFTGFNGDTNFVRNDYTCTMFAKSRSSIAGLYGWRGQNTKDGLEKQRMNRAADFAFRQAWALCPYGPEPVYRYINFLVQSGRFDDAILIAETAAVLPQNKDNDQIAQLPAQLKKWQVDPPSLSAH